LIRIEPYIGTVSSFYVAQCRCGWLSDDLPSEAATKERFAEHASGELDRPRPQTSMKSFGSAISG